jgi:hypothetical protein
VGAYDQSRRILKQAIEIVEAAEGDRSQRLVGPLLALAACNRRQLQNDRCSKAPPTPTARAACSRPDSCRRAERLLAPGMLASEGERALLRAADITAAVPAPAPMRILNVHATGRLVPAATAAGAGAAALPAGVAGRDAHYRELEASYTAGTLWQARAAAHRATGGMEPLRRIASADKVEVRTVVVEATIDADGARRRSKGDRRFRRPEARGSHRPRH